MAGLQVGDQVPPFEAVDHQGRTISSADFLGKQPFVIYFYPKDGTRVCTAQACAFRDAYEDFIDAGAAVVGVSSDTVERHQRFSNERQLPFSLVSDADGKLRRLFGVPKLLGLLPGRVTYVIDKQGIVRLVLNAMFQSQRHIDEALRIVRELNA